MTKSPFELRFDIVSKLIDARPNNIVGDWDMDLLLTRAQQIDNFVSKKTVSNTSAIQSEKVLADLTATDSADASNTTMNTMFQKFCIDKGMGEYWNFMFDQIIKDLTGRRIEAPVGSVWSYQFPRQCGTSIFIDLAYLFLKYSGYKVAVVRKSLTETNNLDYFQRIDSLRGRNYNYILLDNTSYYEDKNFNKLPLLSHSVSNLIGILDITTKEFDRCDNVPN